MAASFTVLDAASNTHGNATTRATLVDITPAVGDVVFWHAQASVGTSPTLTGCGMTWTQVGSTKLVSTGHLIVFKAASGTPSLGKLTYGSSDNFQNSQYAIVRPVGLGALSGVVGTDSQTTSALTLALTTSGSPGGLLAFAVVNNASATWTTDGGGWTQIAQTEATTSCELVNKFTNDSDVVFTPVSNGVVGAMCLEWASASTPVPVLNYQQQINGVA